MGVGETPADCVRTGEGVRTAGPHAGRRADAAVIDDGRHPYD